MGKIVRRVIAILLSVTALILMVLPPVKMEAASSSSDYVMNGSVIESYKGSEEEITLPNFATAVGKDAFSNCDTIRKVVIPDSVKKIDYAAFENCRNLQYVYIPESVKAIGSSAFSGCENLSRVNIPKKCSQIGSGAFARCSSLSNIEVDPENDNFMCSDGVLYTSDGKKLVQYLAGRTKSTYAMPDSIEKIEEYAFWGASGLTDLSISNKVETIPDYAFDNCNGLSNVIIPNSVRSLMAYSFGDCRNLRNVVIPDSVGYIDDRAFYRSDGVNIQFADGKVVAANIANSKAEGDEEAVDSYRDIDEETGRLISSLTPSDNALQFYKDNSAPPASGELGQTKLVGGDAVLLMSPDMPVRGFDIEEAELEDGIAEGDNYSAGSDSGDSGFRIFDGVLVKASGAKSNINIPDGIEKIGNRAFYKNNIISNVKFNDEIEEIGDFAFARSSLESIYIPNGVTKIGYAAFYHCNNLEDVEIPDSVTDIELGAFEGSKWFDDWKDEYDPEGFLIVGDGILLGYKGNDGIVSIPEGVKTIAPGCFKGNRNITSVTFPSTLKKIGEDAFNGCYYLTDTTFNEGLQKIEDRAFQSTAMRVVNIPKTVREIGISAFDNVGNGRPVELVIFSGDDLPDIVNKPTAERMSAKGLITLAFNGVENAIISPSADIESGNVFDVNQYGYRGQVYSVVAGAGNEGQGSLKLEKCTKIPDEKGEVYINPHVKVGSGDYVMVGVKEQAFDDYKNCLEWSGKKANAIKIDGNTSKDVERFLDNISEELSYIGDNVERIDEYNAIKVDIQSSYFDVNQNDKAKAVIPSNTERYLITVSDDATASDMIDKAMRDKYGDKADIDMVPISIDMTDKTGAISIKKFAGKKLELELPLPNIFDGVNDIKVACCDDNGLFENVACTVAGHSGSKSIRFVASHLSPYVIYHVNALNPSASMVTVENGTDDDLMVEKTDVSMNESRIELDEDVRINVDNLAGSTINGVLNTLNRRIDGGFETRWIVIVILLSMAIVLFIYPGKNIRRK